MVSSSSVRASLELAQKQQVAGVALWCPLGTVLAWAGWCLWRHRCWDRRFVDIQRRKAEGRQYNLGLSTT